LKATGGNSSLERWSPSTSQPQNLPATFVGWKQADAYCKWAGARLPTEEEWEKAARGQLNPQGEEDKSKHWWPWGDIPDPARFAHATGHAEPVGSHPLGDSEYGISDLAGNVWELTSSPWDGQSHVMKGGSYLNALCQVRSSVRWASSREDKGAEYLGFRCVVPQRAQETNYERQTDLLPGAAESVSVVPPHQ